MPKVSVIMPAYNAEKYIKEAIDSILNQTFKDFEFIIINDGSIDSTEDIIKSYTDPRIKIINHDTNQGIYASRSDGLKMAQGEFIAILDSDDIAIKNRLEEQLNFMENHPNIAVVGSWMEVINVDHREVHTLKHDCDPVIIKWTHILKNQILNSSSFFRKKTVDKIGYYRKEYEYAEDYDLWSRISRRYKMANMPRVLVQYRIRGKSVTRAPETRKTQKQHISQIIFNNINYYINLNREDFEIFRQVWKNSRISSFKNFIKARRIYKSLFKSYIQKENLNNKDIKKVLANYKVNRSSIFKQYLKYRFPRFYKLFKKLCDLKS